MKLVRITLIALLLVVSTASIPSSAHAHSRRASTRASAHSNPEMERVVREAARIFQISEDCHVRRAIRESTLNPNARNGSHHGLFQQKAKYWPGRVAEYNRNVADEHKVSTSITDPVANARVSARMVGLPGGWKHWGRRCG